MDGMTNRRCPQCGAARLHVERTMVDEPMLAAFMVRGEPLPRRTRLGHVAFCPRCDYAREVHAAPTGAARSAAIDPAALMTAGPPQVEGQPKPKGVQPVATTAVKKPAATKSAAVKKPASTKPAASTRRFAVAASYTGECCATPHVWVACLRAKDAAAAEAVMRKRVEAKQFECHDVIALAFSPKTKTAPSAPSGHRPAEVKQ